MCVRETTYVFLRLKPGQKKIVFIVYPTILYTAPMIVEEKTYLSLIELY